MEKLSDCEFDRCKSIQSYFGCNEPNYITIYKSLYWLTEGTMSITLTLNKWKHQDVWLQSFY